MPIPHYKRHQTVAQLLEMASFLRKHPVILPLRKRISRSVIVENVVPDLDPTDSDRCLCECINPVFRLSQLFGIAPVHFVHTPSSPPPPSTTLALSQNNYVAINVGKSGSLLFPPASATSDSIKNYSCHLEVKWLSIPSVINLIFLMHFLTITTWVFHNVDTVLRIYFNGTDLYTFGLQVQLLYFQACGVLVNAILKRRKLQRVWSLIQEAYSDKSSKDKARIQKSFGLLKKTNYFLVGLTCCTGALFATYFVHFVFRWCFYNMASAMKEMRSGSRGVGGRSDSQLLKVKPPCPFSDGFLLLQKVGYAILIFYNMGFASLFSGYCAILWLLFKDIGLSLRDVLNPKIPSDRDNDTANPLMKVQNPTRTANLNKAEQLEILRIGHETLCRASRILGDCFGLSVLIVCVSSMLSITCAIYTGALRMGIFNANQEESTFSTVSGFYVLSTVHGFIAVFVLMLILVSGQIVQNAAIKPAEIIGTASHLHLNAEEKHQISVFLHKVGTSSTEIRACNVTTIGLSFLAAAATHVTTYILVILQFRLGVEPQVEADEQQQQKQFNTS